jgi:hypothetical protein
VRLQTARLLLCDSRERDCATCAILCATDLLLRLLRLLHPLCSVLPRSCQTEHTKDQRSSSFKIVFSFKTKMIKMILILISCALSWNCLCLFVSHDTFELAPNAQMHSTDTHTFCLVVLFSAECANVCCIDKCLFCLHFLEMQIAINGYLSINDYLSLSIYNISYKKNSIYHVCCIKMFVLFAFLGMQIAIDDHLSVYHTK